MPPPLGAVADFPFSAADPSRLAALLVGRILPVRSLLAPCQPGASTPHNGNLFLRDPLRLPQPGGATHTAGVSVRRWDERRDDLV